MSSSALSSEAHLPAIELERKPKRVNLATQIIWKKKTYQKPDSLPQQRHGRAVFLHRYGQLSVHPLSLAIKGH